MKRFEMIVFILLMWAGAEAQFFGSNSGELSMLAVVAVYVVLTEVVGIGFRKIMKKLNYVKKEG